MISVEFLAPELFWRHSPLEGLRTEDSLLDLMTSLNVGQDARTHHPTTPQGGEGEAQSQNHPTHHTTTPQGGGGKPQPSQGETSLAYINTF